MSNATTFRPAATTALERASMPDSCQCCKRQGLKRTVKMTDGSSVMWMGVGCAAKGTGVSVREINAAERDVQRAADDVARAAAFASSHAELARWRAHLDARCPELRGKVFLQIQKLGGYAAAHAGYCAA